MSDIEWHVVQNVSTVTPQTLEYKYTYHYDNHDLVCHGGPIRIHIAVATIFVPGSFHARRTTGTCLDRVRVFYRLGLCVFVAAALGRFVMPAFDKFPGTVRRHDWIVIVDRGCRGVALFS